MVVTWLPLCLYPERIRGVVDISTASAGGASGSTRAARLARRTYLLAADLNYEPEPL
jgi:hypothetical protein